MGLEVGGKGRRVERLDPQAEMIEIGASGRRRPLRRPCFVGRHDVDERRAGAELRQLALPLL
jgi:hypothetical protein